MAEWRTPVFDRTMDDVKSVDRTSAAYQKGALNADDLNRIEDNYKYLMAKLRSDAIFIPHRLRSFTETVLEYVQTEGAGPEYTLVEYIESSGTQYIDTGFIPNQNTEVEVTFSTMQQELGGIVTACTNWTKNAFCVYVNAVSFGQSCQATNGWFGDGVKHTLKLTKDAKLYCDGSVVWTGTVSQFTAPVAMLLLAEHSSETGVSQSPDAKLYACKIWDNGTLVRDFVPCLDENGVAGLYDLVEGKFYGNSGTGTFVVGEEITVNPESGTDPVFELIEITTTYTDWQEHNLPWLSEINRIRANHNALVRLFLVGLGLPVLAESNYLDWQEVNDWERIAAVGKTIFENMEKEYVLCGTLNCGGDRLL